MRMMREEKDELYIFEPVVHQMVMESRWLSTVASTTTFRICPTAETISKQRVRNFFRSGVDYASSSFVSVK